MRGRPPSGGHGFARFQPDNVVAGGEPVRRTGHRLGPEAPARAVRGEGVACIGFDEVVPAIDPELRASSVGAPEPGPRSAVVVTGEIGERVVHASLAQASRLQEVEARAFDGFAAGRQFALGVSDDPCTATQLQRAGVDVAATGREVGMLAVSIGTGTVAEGLGSRGDREAFGPELVGDPDPERERVALAG
jgi:hypothetical protein